MNKFDRPYVVALFERLQSWSDDKQQLIKTIALHAGSAHRSQFSQQQRHRHEGNNIGINFAAGCLFRGRVAFNA